MSNTKNTGGPAFPQSEWDSTGRGVTPVKGGMSLRDYFAAKAMQGMAPYTWRGAATYEEPARKAYAMADAMLKAREQ